MGKINNKDILIKNGDIENIAINDKYDYVLLIHALNEIVDVQAMLENFKCVAKRQTRFVIVGYNKLWEPAIKLAEKFGIKINQPAPNWLSANDVKNFLHLSGYETIKEYKNILLPKKIPLISTLINGLIAKFPLVNNLCLIYTIVARCIIPLEKPGPSVSIIIPCKNEKGNIQTSVERIPNMGSHTEIIFGDDKSTDGTSDEIRRVMKLYPEKEIKLYEGPGVCKADNVWAGLKKATGDILMILDADLTVLPEELPKFYRAIIEGKGEFINPQKVLGLLILHLVCDRKMSGGVVKTIVGTNMLDNITKKLGLKLYETPVGFKYISELMIKDDILVGGEEAGGMGFKNYIPERDGSLAGLLLLEMMAYRKKSMDKILAGMEKEFGRYYYLRDDLKLKDLNVDVHKFKTVKKLLDKDVVEVKDYDGVKLIASDGSWLMFRGSGTEPIMRVYVESRSLKKTKSLLALGKSMII